MNRKLRKEPGREVAEKRSYKWSMTGFMYSVWGTEMKEAIEDVELKF